MALACAVSPQGAAGQSYQELDINTITAGAQAAGALFTDPNLNPAFEVMDGSGIHTFWNSQLWIGGQDVNGQLKLARTHYDLNESMAPGPISDDYSSHASWNRVWKLSKAEVDSFIGWYDGTITDPNYQIPSEILAWPAHGDVSMSQSFYLAPFYDRNQDGIYDPVSSGDYPLIKGDQALFWIMNDENLPTPNGTTIGLEVHCMLYAFDCDVNWAMNNTVFGQFDFINRRTQTLFDTHIGVWSDLDVGHAFDDYIQSDVERASYFAYSADFGAEPAMAQSVTFLSGPFLDADGQDDTVSFNVSSSVHGLGYDDGIVDNERSGMASFLFHYSTGSGFPAQQSPVVATDYYRLMEPTWLDGSDVLYGGIGHANDPNANQNQPAMYMFPADSDPQGFGTGGNPQAAWSEETVNNPPDDRRGIGSTEGFTFVPNQRETIELAYVFASDPLSVGSTDVVISTLKGRIDDIKNHYDNGLTGCTIINSIQDNSDLDELEIGLYPNPASDQVQISIPSLEGRAEFTLYDAAGRVIKTDFINQTETGLTVAEYPAGVYLFEFLVGDAWQVKRLIIK